jgi:asparagine synthase (glutamine-hydrolysing)
MAEKAGVFSEAANRALNGDQALRALCRDVFDASGSADPYDRILYFFEKIHLVNLLDRLDMQSMAASVEARVPFVDHELVEFVSAIPLRHKMRWKSPMHMIRAAFMKSENVSEHLDINKYLLRRLADDHLPRQISRRKKLGFPAPLDAWLSGPLRTKAREILLDPVTRRRGLFNTDTLERLLSAEPDLRYDFYGKRVWMLMNVELWFRAHIDAAA